MSSSFFKRLVYGTLSRRVMILYLAPHQPVAVLQRANLLRVLRPRVVRRRHEHLQLALPRRVRRRRLEPGLVSKRATVGPHVALQRLPGRHVVQVDGEGVDAGPGNEPHGFRKVLGEVRVAGPARVPFAFQHRLNDATGGKVRVW